MSFVAGLDEYIISSPEGKIPKGFHVTIFFGINPELVDESVLYEELEKFPIKEACVKSLSSFELPAYKSRILVLELKDEELKIAHRDFLKFPHIEDIYTLAYKPHVTLGYLKDNISISDINYDGPLVLSLEKPTYKVKDFS